MVQYLARWRKLLDRVEVKTYRDITARLHD